MELYGAPNRVDLFGKTAGVIEQYFVLSDVEKNWR